jgi:hypothetical protein
MRTTPIPMPMPRAIFPALLAAETTALGTFIARFSLHDIGKFLPRVEVSDVALVIPLRGFLELLGTRVVRFHGFVGLCHILMREAFGLEGHVVGGRGDGGEGGGGAAAVFHFGVAAALIGGEDCVDGGGGQEAVIVGGGGGGFRVGVRGGGLGAHVAGWGGGDGVGVVKCGLYAMR